MDTTKPVHTTFDNADTTDITTMADLFYQAKRAEGLSPNTITFYRQQLNHMIKYYQQNAITVIGGITSGNIREMLLWHQDTGHDPGGIHAVYRCLKTFLRWYEIEVEPAGWKNPIRKVRAPHVPQEILEPATVDNVHALLKVCKGVNFLDLRDKALFLFLLDTGCRAREALKVELDNVDLITGEIKIKQGKGNKDRSVFIGKATRKAIKSYVKQREPGNELLWVTNENERLTYIGLRAILLRRSEQAGVPRQTLHSFRRAFAINMLRAGTDLITLARLMGHSDLTVLQRYLKQMPDDLRAAHIKGSPVDNWKL